MRRAETLQQVSRRWFQTSKTVIAYNQHKKEQDSNTDQVAQQLLAKEQWFSE